MLNIVKDWFNRHFSHPEVVLLMSLIGTILFLVLIMGHILMPVLVSVILAYLLDWVVQALERRHLAHVPAVVLVFTGFLLLFILLFVFLLPLVWKQIALFFMDFPKLIAKIHSPLNELSTRFPDYFSPEQLDGILKSLVESVKSWGGTVLSASLSSLAGVITWAVYLVLIPLLVFFFLKDRDLICHWLSRFLPEQRGLVSQVAAEVNEQIGNYCWGKTIEILLTWFFSFIVFSLLGLKYSLVLTFVLSLSVLIPYVGVIVVTFPFAIVAYLQFGFGIELLYILLAYFGIQAFLGTLIEPLLFSEALNLHPTAIILATLVFGGLWGFWGIFFAIPLATVVKAILNAWPASGISHSATP